MSKIKSDLKNGKAVLGIMIEEVTTPNIARVLATCGFEYFIIDCEHGSFNYESVANIISVARGAGIIPMVRVPEIKKEAIFKPLEAGAMGLLIPMIKTANDAKRVVEEARYAPVGNRGISYMKVHDNFSKKSNPEHTKNQNDAKRVVEEARYAPVGNRGISYMKVHDNFSHKSNPQHTKNQNDEIMIILQIETKEAVDNIDEILSVEGIDAVIIGPNDLSQSYGILGEFDNPILINAIDKVIEASKKHGIISGTHIGDKNALIEWSKKGMRLLMFSTESGLMIEYGSQCVSQLQKGLEESGISII